MSKVLADLAATLAVEEPVVAKKETPTPITKKDKFEILANVRKQLDKQFETTNSIVRLGSKVGKPIPSIATNLPSLDYEVLQCGGIPRGRIVEIYGPFSSGKTTLCLHLIAQEQASTDNLCAVVDAEHALDVTYANKLGVNTDDLLISQPDSGEQALETVDALIESKAVSLIVVDSVAALVPQAELDGEYGDSNMGLQARLMSQAMRKLRGKASLNNVTVVFTNQIREKIGVMYGSPETVPGGNALKFYASVRLDVRKKDLIGDKESPTGHKMQIKAVKNKCGAPMRLTLIDLIYGEGLDTLADFISYAATIGAIKQSGKWYKFKEKNIGDGLTDLVNNVKLDSELFKEIKTEVERIRSEQKESEE